jgi:hypothetical protein
LMLAKALALMVMWWIFSAMRVTVGLSWLYDLKAWEIRQSWKEVKYFCFQDANTEYRLVGLLVQSSLSVRICHKKDQTSVKQVPVIN